jgi:hypothetical protein
VGLQRKHLDWDESAGPGRDCDERRNQSHGFAKSFHRLSAMKELAVEAVRLFQGSCFALGLNEACEYAVRKAGGDLVAGCELGGGAEEGSVGG